MEELLDAPHSTGNDGAITAQSRSGPGSSSPPPLVADPNLGAVNQPPVVVRGGFGGTASADSSATCFVLDCFFGASSVDVPDLRARCDMWPFDAG